MPMGEPPHEYISHPEQLTDRRFPDRYDLDAVAPDHPVYIRAVWGWWSRRPFPSVANSLALRRAGVTRDTPAPHNVEIVKDARGDPTGVFLERNFVPVLEYTLFRDLPRFKYRDRVESVRLGAQAYAAAGTTSLYEGHGLTPTVIRAYRENAERSTLTLRMHAPVSMPSAAFDDKRLIDLFHHYAGPAGGRGRGDDILRVEGINLGGHADTTVAGIIAAGYPYDQWAGHFYQAMTVERFVKLGIEAARLGLRVNCVVSRDIEYGLSAFEAIDKEEPIRDRRWVMIHVNQATDAQIRRMKVRPSSGLSRAGGRGPGGCPARRARVARRSQSSFGSPGTTIRRPKGRFRTAMAIAVFVLPQPMFPTIMMFVLDTSRGRRL